MFDHIVQGRGTEGAVLGVCNGAQAEDKVLGLAQELMSPLFLLDSRPSGAWEQVGAILFLGDALGL